MYHGEPERSGWRPGGACTSVPGRSRYEGKDVQLRGPRLTTNSRANAAVEAYWQRYQTTGQRDGSQVNGRAAQKSVAMRKVLCMDDAEHPLSKIAGKTMAGALPGNLPGGERQIAQRVKKEGRSANIKLGNEHLGLIEPSWPGTPRDLAEKERYPQRGIAGFTGTSPTPDQQAPGWPEPRDPAETYAINALDQRRPWTTGIKGYGGHQLPEDVAGRTHDDDTEAASIYDSTREKLRSSGKMRQSSFIQGQRLEAALDASRAEDVQASFAPEQRFSDGGHAEVAPEPRQGISKQEVPAVSTVRQQEDVQMFNNGERVWASPVHRKGTQFSFDVPQPATHSTAQLVGGDARRDGQRPPTGQMHQDVSRERDGLGPPRQPAPWAHDEGHEGQARRSRGNVIGGHPEDAGIVNAATAGRPWAQHYDPRGAYWSEKAHHERISDTTLAERPGSWWHMRPGTAGGPHTAATAAVAFEDSTLDPHMKRAVVRRAPWLPEYAARQEELLYERSPVKAQRHGAVANEIRYQPRTAWE